MQLVRLRFSEDDKLKGERLLAVNNMIARIPPEVLDRCLQYVDEAGSFEASEFTIEMMALRDLLLGECPNSRSKQWNSRLRNSKDSLMLFFEKLHFMSMGEGGKRIKKSKAEVVNLVHLSALMQHVLDSLEADPHIDNAVLPGLRERFINES